MNWITKILGTKTKVYRIEVWEGKDGWRSRIMHRNGNILFNSEAYSSKAACLDTVENFANVTGMKVLVEKK